MNVASDKTVKPGCMPSVGFLVTLAVLMIVCMWIMPPFRWHTRPTRPTITIAMFEADNLVMAIEFFRAEYGRWPVSEATALLTNADFTFGTHGTRATVVVTNGTGFDVNNSEAVRILMAVEPTNGGQSALRNTRRIRFLTAKTLGDNGRGGVGTDGVFRDPWGNPYIITLDLNGDGMCEDAVYRTKGAVSVWSLGPDRTASSSNQPGEGVNKDNIHVAR